MTVARRSPSITRSSCGLTRGKNAIAAVVDVGVYPGAAATSGDTVWVYAPQEDLVLEVDAESNDVRHTTGVSIYANARDGAGPVLTANETGAWLVGYGMLSGKHALVHVLGGGRGMREYAVEGAPDALVAADGVLSGPLAPR